MAFSIFRASVTVKLSCVGVASPSGASCCSSLALQLTTVSLDYHNINSITSNDVNKHKSHVINFCFQ